MSTSNPPFTMDDNGKPSSIKTSDQQFIQDSQYLSDISNNHLLSEKDLSINELKDILEIDIKICDEIPTTYDILEYIPAKESIKQLFSTSGIFTIKQFLTTEEFRDYSQILSEIRASTDTKDNRYHQLTALEKQNKHKAYDRYVSAFISKPKLVLNAIVNGGPLVIAAHRYEIETTLRDLINQNILQPAEALKFWRLSNADIRDLVHRILSRGLINLGNSERIRLETKISVLQMIDVFRSPNYSLIPYFKHELELLKSTNYSWYTEAVEHLTRVVDEREGVAALGSKGIRTYKPTQCIKLMAFLVRSVFSNLQPCDRKLLCNRFTFSAKGPQNSTAPILSLHTKNGQALTRAHGEVYDAVCSLWAAGNSVITDLMIARTIWPNTSRHGGETFSPKELDTISQLMEDLRTSYSMIDATNEFRKYKKIGNSEQWTLASSILPYSVIYQTINGSQYLHRAYKLLAAPMYYTYASSLAQIFSAPITILEPCKYKHKDVRLPRTLRASQIKSLLLARINHFHNPSFKKREKSILFERIYEAYEISNQSTIDIQKKDRSIARKIAINALDTFVHYGLISSYNVIKKGGEYHSIKIDL